MDALTQDPELAQTMVRLLYDKLRQKRRELDELRGEVPDETLLIDSSTLRRENNELKEEMITLRLSLEAAREGQDCKVIASENIEEMGLQSHHTMEDMKCTELEQMAEVQGLADEIETCKSNYKRAKKENMELHASLSKTQANFDDVQISLQAVRDKVKALEDQWEATPDQFDFSDFLASNPSKGSCYLSESAMKPLVPSKAISEGSQTTGARADVRLLVIDQEDTVWTEENMERMVLFGAAFLYVPGGRQGKGVWKLRDVNYILKNTQRHYSNVVCKAGGAYYYLGCYECLHFSSVTLDTATRILGTEATRRAVDATVTSREQVAPVVCQLVDDMYKAGVLSLECFALQRSGFDHELESALKA
ncbi:hypothetical protein OH77DRAFT_458519 [Trametes cingulata]|nr:hypothetical protein OH77DRAFT_458519 [Trametes cingulata]